MKNTLTILFSFFLALAYPQSTITNSFGDINNAFYKETESASRNKNRGLASPYFAFPLPNHFFELINNESNTVFGVSDANNDTVQAYQQALDRAKAMAALMAGCYIQSKGDFFTNELENAGLANKHIIFSLLTKDKTTDSPEIKELLHFRTIFNETIVVGKILDKPGIPTRVRSDFFLSETSRNGQTQLNNRISMGFAPVYAKKPTDTIIYTLLDNKFHLESYYQRKKSAELKSLCKYCQRNEVETNELDLISSGYSKASLMHGLWPGYLNAQLRQLRKATEDEKTFRKMNDVRNNKVTNLGDEITKSHVKFNINSVLILNNAIYVKTNIIDNNLTE